MKFFDRPAKIKASFGTTLKGSEYEDLSELQHIYPIIPAARSEKGWWDKMKKHFFIEQWGRPDYKEPTMKYCPGVFDYTNCGYIVPCLFDMNFIVRGEDQNIMWQIPEGIPQKWIMSHDQRQVDSCPIAHGKNTGLGVVKVTTPWWWETPKGWRTIITKPFYNYSNDFDVCPGILDTDLPHLSNHLINVFLRFNVVDKDIIFRAGQPLCQLIPFKRQNTKLILTDEPNEKSKKLIREGFVRRKSRFTDNPNVTGKTLLKHRDPSTKKYE